MRNNAADSQPHGTLTLYHGSKTGLAGHPRPDYAAARRACDFGRGFYLDTRPDQAKAVLCQAKNPVFYQVSLDLDGLRCVRLDGLAWAMYIACARRRFGRGDSPDLYDAISRIDAGCDVVIGPTADGRIGPVLQNFLEGLYTDRMLLACMHGLAPGDQYALKSRRACSRVQILTAHSLTAGELSELAHTANRQREAGFRLIKDIHRRQGLYIDEILQGGPDHEIAFPPNPSV